MDLLTLCIEVPVINFLNSDEYVLEDDVIPNCCDFASSKYLVK